MSVYRHAPPSDRRLPHAASWAAVLVAGLMVIAPAHSASFGHSRLVSGLGEPLRIDVPVTQLSADEAASLRVAPAPASAWSAAGLVPPVDLAALHAQLGDGFAPNTHVIRVWSEAIFNQPVADLLLDVHTVRGVERYQVSLLAQGGSSGVRPSQASGGAPAGSGQRAAASTVARSQQPAILVRNGDNMFAIAQRYAVPGVTVYQMMIALHRANPEAFIQGNLNLVRAGERLTMPEYSALTALSDREARRLFHEQVVAFELYRQSLQGKAASDQATALPLSAGNPQGGSQDTVSNVPEDRLATGDQLKLSSGRSDAVPGASTAATAGVADTPAGTTSLRQASPGGLGGTVAHNLASGVAKAAHAATADSDAIANTRSPIGDGTSASSGAGAGTGSTDGTAQPGAASIQARSPGLAGAPDIDDGTRSDDQLATRKAIDDAQERVSQLEENVKNLNRALQSQGEAAKDLIIDGAIGLRQSLTDVATAVTDATIGDEDPGDTAVSTTGPAATQPGALQGSAAEPSPGRPDESVASSSRAPSTGASGGTSSVSSSKSSGSPPVEPSASTEASQKQLSVSSKMDSITTWVQGHLLGVVTGVLALIVLIIAWVLRRANAAPSDATVTPEMVKEKLNQINLDLADPSVDDSSPSRS